MRNPQQTCGTPWPNWRGRLQEAIEHYQQALQLNPDYIEAHDDLGIRFPQIGRLQEAIEHYQQALHLKPDYADAHNDLGVALAKAGRLQEAIDHYQQALLLKPDLPMSITIWLWPMPGCSSPPRPLTRPGRAWNLPAPRDKACRPDRLKIG